MIVLIAGGDGSVLQVVQDLQNRGINIANCIFGHVPLGTGNDLANSMGFDCKETNKIKLNKIKQNLIKLN